MSNERAHRSPRADFLRTRERLIVAARELLTERGRVFTLADLARQSGVAPATTYRHFDDVHAVFEAYYDYELGHLNDRLASAWAEADPGDAFASVCQAWADGAVEWGRAATHIRSAAGYLERVRRHDDPVLDGMYDALASVVTALIEQGDLSLDVDYAVLLWVTIFDERVVVDLHETLGWSADRIATELGHAVRGAWGAAGSHDLHPD